MSVCVRASALWVHAQPPAFLQTRENSYTYTCADEEKKHNVDAKKEAGWGVGGGGGGGWGGAGGKKTEYEIICCSIV